MNDEQWLRDAIVGIQSNTAVMANRLEEINRRLEAIDKSLYEHDRRLRDLEADVGNNKMVVRVVTGLAVIIGGGVFTIIGSIIKATWGG